MSEQWAAISVRLQPEAVDDVSMALERLVGPHLAVETRPQPQAGDWPVVAHVYLAPGAGQDSARHDVLRALEMLRLAGAGTVGAASEELVDADAYHTRWRSFFAPLAVGEHLVVVPAWLRQPEAHADRIPIFLDSGMAFGTGHHPTTRLALEALEAAMNPGDVVVDVGTGSGVLAIAAVKLGALRVYAFDRDADARPAAMRNVRRNGVSDRIAMTIPSNALAVPEPATLVVANIVASVHMKLMWEYASLLAPAGRLLLGGVLAARADHVVLAARPFGLRLKSTAVSDEWRLLEFMGETPPAAPTETKITMRGMVR